MNTLVKTAATLSSILFLIGPAATGAEEAAESSANTSPSVVVKVEKAVKRGAKAAASGIERGAKAAAKGIEHGVTATVRGVEHGAKATGNAARRVANKMGKSPAPSPTPDK